VSLPQTTRSSLFSLSVIITPSGPTATWTDTDIWFEDCSTRRYSTRAGLHSCTANVDRCEHLCRFVCSYSNIDCRERRCGGRRALQCGAARTVARRKELRYSQGRMVLVFRDLDLKEGAPQDRHFLQQRATNRTAAVHPRGRATEGAGTYRWCRH